MINLLPISLKKDIKAARANSVLVKYLTVLIFGAIFLAVISYGAFLILDSLKSSASNIIQDNTSKSAKYLELKSQVQQADNEISSASNIINQEVKYSKILTRLANIMPAGTVIDQVSLGNDIFLTKSSITFYASSANAAATLRNNLEKSTPNGLFQSVTLQSLSGSDKSTVSGYNNTLTIDVIFNKEPAS